MKRSAVAANASPGESGEVGELGADVAPALEAHDHGKTDPYPFTRDPWWTKALILVIVFLPLAAIAYVAIWGILGYTPRALDLWLFFGLWTFTGLGISVGFHRMLTHRAFVAKPVTRVLLLLAGSMAMEGPPASWAATHQRHHAKADREGDPHSPVEGFWHSHTGWMVRNRFVNDGPAYDRLMADPIVSFMTRYWWIWAVLSFVLPAVIGLAVYHTFAGALSAFLWGALIRMFALHHTTWSVNSIGHMVGTRPYKTTDKGANNVVVALLGWGEGWHNNHHAFPKSAYIGLRWWQVDIGGWLVAFLKAIRQITNVWHPTKAEKRARSKRSA